MATTIPGKQLVWAGSYDALRTNLHAREIGLCTDDLVLYVKYGQELIPCGYCEGGVGISVDGHKINLTERSTYQAYPTTMPAVQGALKIAQNNVGNNGVRIGDMGSDIGQLAPNVPANSVGKALYIGANGRMEWGVVDTSMDSPDGSIQIESEIVANQKVYHITLPDLVSPGSYVKVVVDAKGRIVGGGVLESADIPDGIIGKEKLNLEDMMPVIPGDGIEIQLVSGLLIFSVADDSLSVDKMNAELKLRLVPECPDTGTYTLKAIDGVIQWVED